MKKVAVSQEASDKKRNPLIPEKMGVLVPYNFFLSKRNHFNKKDSFLSAAGREEQMSTESWLSGTLAFLPVAAFCWTYMLQTHNAPKMTIIYFNTLSGRHNYFYLFRKTFTPQNRR